jgi:hypothetical protein
MLFIEFCLHLHDLLVPDSPEVHMEIDGSNFCFYFQTPQLLAPEIHPAIYPLQSIITNFIDTGTGRRSHLHKLSLEEKVAMVFRDEKFDYERFHGSKSYIEVVFNTSWANSFSVVFHWVTDTAIFLSG